MKTYFYLSFFALMFFVAKNNAMSLEEQMRNPVIRQYIQDPKDHVNYPQCLFEALGYNPDQYRSALNQSCEKCHRLVLESKRK